MIESSAKPASPAAATPGRPQSVETATTLADLVTLAEQREGQRAQARRAAAELNDQRTRLHLLQTTIRSQQGRLAAMAAAQREQGDVPSVRPLVDALGESEALRGRLIAQLEATLQAAERERQEQHQRCLTLEEAIDAGVARLTPEIAQIYARLVGRGVLWPIVRERASACGGCAATVNPAPPEGAWACPACGRLLVPDAGPVQRPGY